MAEMQTVETPVTRFPVRSEILVRYADADVLGHVNNAKYFTYMEEARIAYLKHVQELNFVGKTSFRLSVVLATISCDFIAPARIHDVIVAAVGATKVGRKSLTMEYRLFDKKSGKALAKGSSTAVMFDFEKNQSVEIPESIREQIKILEDNSPQEKLGQFE